MKPEERALKFLESKKWDFNGDKSSARDLRLAFTWKGNCGRDVLVNSIVYLKTKAKYWDFFSLKDVKNLDEARKVFQKYNKKNK